MKRIHLFEFIDLPWLPNVIRACMTRLMIVMHNLIKAPDDLKTLIEKVLPLSEKNCIVDLCSGSGGPLISVHQQIQQEHHTKDLDLVLTDLYPDQALATRLNRGNDNKISYQVSPVDATNVDDSLKGVRTLVGGFHHMKPKMAKQILEDAQAKAQPICIYEISDNSLPTFLWWISIPTIFIMTLFITPFARPFTWQQAFLTYLIPIIPFCFAWDGAVSNARTYTLDDMKQLLEQLETDAYDWEMGRIEGKAKKLYLLGYPTNH